MWIFFFVYGTKTWQMESETKSVNFSYCYIKIHWSVAFWMDLLSVHDFTVKLHWSFGRCWFTELCWASFQVWHTSLYSISIYYVGSGKLHTSERMRVKCTHNALVLLWKYFWLCRPLKGSWRLQESLSGVTQIGKLKVVTRYAD